MHGSSSVPQDEVARINAAGGKLDPSARGVDENEYLPAAKLGVTKINIDTDGRLVWTRVHREFFRDKPGRVRFPPAGQDVHGRIREVHRAQEQEARQRRAASGGARGAGRQEITRWMATSGRHSCRFCGVAAEMLGRFGKWNHWCPEVAIRLAEDIIASNVNPVDVSAMSFGVLIFLGVVAFFLLVTSIRIAQEYQRGVVFRLGRYVGTRGPGLYLLIPFGIETQSLIDIRIKTVPIESQETITRDSVTIRVNAALWYKVVDPAKSVIAVTDVFAAIYQLALTTLRNTIGQHDLDEVLQARDKINDILRQSVIPATAGWGIEIERLEMKDVELPANMQQVMAMQAEAIREKRARIIKAEAELEASIKLTQASEQMMTSPAALELRRMQMISEVGADNNTTTIVMIPSDFVTMAKSLTEYVADHRTQKPPTV